MPKDVNHSEGYVLLEDGTHIPVSALKDDGTYAPHQANPTNTTQFWRADGTWNTPAGGGGGSAHVIEDEGTPLTQRTNLNFKGAAITATDNAGADSTDVTVDAAPTGASYITTASESGLSAENVLGTSIVIRAAPTPSVGPDGAIWVDTTNGPVYVSNGVSWVERWRSEGSTRLAQLADHAHASLSSIGTDDHHAKSHTHNADGSGSVAFTSLTGAFDSTAPTTSAVGDAAAAGSATVAAHRDHTHGREGFGTPGSSAVGDAATAGTATTVAHSDHVHGREAFGTPVAVGTANANGSAATVSRSDHVHNQNTALGAVNLDFTKMTAPGTPAASHDTLYVDTADKVMKVKDENGDVFIVGLKAATTAPTNTSWLWVNTT